MEMEKGVEGKGRKRYMGRGEGCMCKRGVDERKRCRGKCHGLQNLRNGDGQERLGKKGLWGGRKGNSKSKRQGAKGHKAREQGKKKQLLSPFSGCSRPK